MKPIENKNHKRHARRNLLFLTIYSLLFILCSCGPVNRFTRLKKTPKEYNVNYCIEGVGSPKKLRTKKEPWVVFSDKEQNHTFIKAGGKVVMKQIDFMEPFLVIKEKGDYLKLIKYSGEIVKNGKLTDRKKAEYYGWIPKSEVLLYRGSISDIQSGLSNKIATIINDTLPFNKSEYLISNDSILTFKGEDLRTTNGKIPFYGIVYAMKRSKDKKRTLISRVPSLSLDSASHEIIGWVDNSLIRNMGQQLHIEYDKLPIRATFKDYQNDTRLNLSSEALSNVLDNQHTRNIFSYAPVTNFCRKDSSVLFKSGLPFPVLNYENNYVLNVNGNKIYHKYFQQLKKDSRKINIAFVFEGSKQIITQYPELINAIQNLQPMLESNHTDYHVNVGGTLGFAGQSGEMPIYKLTTDIMAFIDSLSIHVNHINKLRPLPAGRTWPALREAIKLFNNKENEVNIIILLGETGYQSESAETFITDRLHENNCRLFACQLYGGEPNTYNNFVLQVENMIKSSADKIAIKKREVIVSPGQLRENNSYKENAKNIYSLDFPQNSMIQGWILFPEKRKTIDLGVFSNCVDTLINQVKDDNISIIKHIQQAFNQVGNHRNKYDSTMVAYYNMPLQSQLNVKFANQFHNQAPLWYLPSSIIEIPDSLQYMIHNHLLLNETELTDLRQFLTAISSRQIDYKSGKGEKTNKKKVCNCPDDERAFPEQEVDRIVEQPEYAGTRKLRKRLVRYYLEQSNLNKVCKTKKKALKQSRIAIIHETITSCPSKNSILNHYRVKDIRKKKRLSNEMLDYTLQYFKMKKEYLESNLNSLPKFSSNGQTYYWIDEKLLP
ncbi:hypothetical protein DW228_18370 [Bacteroides fragilis]|uniref:Lipoprotein n=1 Tax=Bacteroides fragilis TaxID=817 RepID=A0A396BUT2_BACFG|nr:type VI secretion system protein TssR domain-containing protein [Bacteroides fragilis]RHH07899.1 hypothetical protein DW228_18370 [Bacteroides fragilis]